MAGGMAGAARSPCAFPPRGGGGRESRDKGGSLWSGWFRSRLSSKYVQPFKKVVRIKDFVAMFVCSNNADLTRPRLR